MGGFLDILVIVCYGRVFWGLEPEGDVLAY